MMRKQNDPKNINQQDIDRLATLIDELYGKRNLDKHIAQQAMRYHSKHQVNKLDIEPLQVYTNLLNLLHDHHLRSIGVFSRLNARSRGVYDIILTELERLNSFEDTDLQGPNLDQPQESPSIAFQTHLDKQLLELTYLAFPEKLEQEKKFAEQRKLEQMMKEENERKKKAEEERKNELEKRAFERQIELNKQRRKLEKGKEKVFVVDNKELNFAKLEEEKIKLEREKELKQLQIEREQARQIIIAKKKEIEEMKKPISDFFREIQVRTSDQVLNTSLMQEEEQNEDLQLSKALALKLQLRSFFADEMKFYPKGNAALGKLQQKLDVTQDESILIQIAKDTHKVINGFQIGNPLQIFSKANWDHRKASTEKIKAIIDGSQIVQAQVGLTNQK